MGHAIVRAVALQADDPANEVWHLTVYIGQETALSNQDKDGDAPSSFTAPLLSSANTPLLPPHIVLDVDPSALTHSQRSCRLA